MAGLLGVALFCGCPAASTPGTSTPKPPENRNAGVDEKPTGKPADAIQWTALFDGQSLKNWKLTDFGLPGDATIEDGQLIIGPGTRLAGVSWTGTPLPKMNYEVSAEAQRVEGSDFFYGLTFPVRDTFCSLIVGGWGGKTVGLSNVNEEDASENETHTDREFTSGKWYRIRLRVTEPKIEAWIDDVQVVNLPTAEKNIGVRLEMELQYPFGLATYKTKGAVRDLKIRELRPEELAVAR